MIKLLWRGLLLLAACLPGRAPAQTVTLPAQKIVYRHQVFWGKLEAHDFLNNGKWGYGLDLVTRTRDDLAPSTRFSTLNRFGIRPWVNYQFNENVRFSLSPLGYMRTDEYEGKPEDVGRPTYHELRTTFQLFHHHYSFNKRMMHTFRHRYELRWQERPLTEGEYRFFTRYRFRYRMRLMLNDRNFYDNGVLYALASNEIGINIGRNVVMNTFNQNRLYLGLGYRFGNAIRAEVRYVDRFRTRGATGFEFDNGRGPMLALFIDKMSKISFRKDYILPVRYFD
jgi:hypothetical protein